MAPPDRGFIIDTVLPVAVFPPLVVAAGNVIFGQIFNPPSVALKSLGAACAPALLKVNEGAYRLPYTGLAALDETLCGIVAFFHAVLDPALLPFHLTLFTAFGVIAYMLFVEAARNGRSLVAAVPMLVGISCQVITVGATMPLYWFFMTSAGVAGLHLQPRPKPGSATDGITTRGGPDARIDKGHASGIVFSLFVGYVIPTAAMFYLADPYVTAIWQFFPVWMSVAQFAHRVVLRSTASGHAIVRNTYFVLFLVSFAAHSYAVWPLVLGDRAEFARLFIPEHPAPRTLSLEEATHGFLKWDGIFALLSIQAASFWFAGTVGDIVMILGWWAIALPFFGPGAAIAGIFLWREHQMNGEPVSVEVTVKTKKAE